MDWTIELYLVTGPFFFLGHHIQIDSGVHSASYEVDNGGCCPIKQPEHCADQTLPSNTEVKSMWSYSPTTPYFFMVWCLSLAVPTPNTLIFSLLFSLHIIVFLQHLDSSFCLKNIILRGFKHFFPGIIERITRKILKS